MKKKLDSYCISFVALRVNNERFRNNKKRKKNNGYLCILPSVSTIFTPRTFGGSFLKYRLAQCAKNNIPIIPTNLFIL